MFALVLLQAISAKEMVKKDELSKYCMIPCQVYANLNQGFQAKKYHAVSANKLQVFIHGSFCTN